MTNLLHSNTDYVDEGVVRAIPEPDFTDTWHPIAHHKIIDALQDACKDVGLGVMRKDYSINNTGARMFGVWDLDHKTNGSCYSLGFRNSTDKSMAVGVVGGFRVFVCDNLALSGEYLQFHKHTSGLSIERLRFMANEALTGAWVEMEKLEMWINKLAAVELNEVEFKEVTFNLMKANVVAPPRFKPFIEAHEIERDPRVHSRDFTGKNLSQWYGKGTTLHTVHSACTRLLRGTSLFKQADRNKKLIQVCDDYVLQKAA